MKTKTSSILDLKIYPNSAAVDTYGGGFQLLCKNKYRIICPNDSEPCQADCKHFCSGVCIYPNENE